LFFFKKFCVGVHVDDETILWDNYQKEEIEAVLQGHLINLYSLPQPYTIKTEFRLEHTPNYKSFVPAEWRDKGYSHTNMVDFFFSGQPVEELLSQIGYLEYFVSYLSLDRPLDEIEFKAKDWPVSEGGYIAWNFRRYASLEAELVDTDVNHPKIAGFPHFKEWLHTVLKHKGTEGQEMVKYYFEFHTTVAEGISFITILPHEMGDILYISEGKDAWAVCLEKDKKCIYSVFHRGRNHRAFVRRIYFYTGFSGICQWLLLLVYVRAVYALYKIYRRLYDNRRQAAEDCRIFGDCLCHVPCTLSERYAGFLVCFQYYVCSWCNCRGI